VVLLGDFNADAATVAAGLGDAFTVAALPADAAPTRPGTPPGWIDHVVARAATVTDAAVVDVAGRSDHNLVRATVT
jgi:endonuclease/exonuclease/phosphatase family metal-dependent hydrolase